MKLSFNNRGFSLIGILILAVIVIGGCLFFGYNLFNGQKKPETMTDYSNSQKNTVYGQSMDAAKAVQCQSNLGQLRSGIGMIMQSEERAPASLDELRYPSDMQRCPMTKEAYIYDPNTGQVRCPSHPQF